MSGKSGKIEVFFLHRQCLSTHTPSLACPGDKVNITTPLPPPPSPYPTPLVVLVDPPANICRPSPPPLCRRRQYYDTTAAASKSSSACEWADFKAFFFFLLPLFSRPGASLRMVGQCVPTSTDLIILAREGVYLGISKKIKIRWAQSSHACSRQVIDIS